MAAEDLDLMTIAQIIGVVLLAIETFILFFLIVGLKGVPLTLLRAKLKNELIAIVERSDRTKTIMIPKIEENYMQLQEFGIGQVVVSESKVIPFDFGVRSINVHHELPEGYIGSDVQHGYVDSPQMIDRYNERMAEAMLKEKEKQNPQNKMQTTMMMAGILLAIGIAGYVLISAITQYQFCQAPVPVIIQTATTLAESGIY